MLYVIEKVFKLLNDEGFDVYLIGGYVRDKLLAKQSDDLDFATNAHVVDLQRIFNNYQFCYINEKLGSAAIKIKDHIIQITTFRFENKYDDKRHPQEVIFTENLIDDVKRRDFTVNALALNNKGEIIDYVGGLKDLDKKIIKTIGDPYVRFSEDALRILRAIRFKNYLDFKYDDDTYLAMKECSHYLSFLSRQRIMEELNKLLSIDYNNLKELWELDFIKYIFNDIDINKADIDRIIEHLDLLKKDFDLSKMVYLIYLLMYDDFESFEKFAKENIFDKRLFKSLIKVKKASFNEYQDLKEAVLDLKINYGFNNLELTYLCALKNDFFYSMVYQTIQKQDSLKAPSTLRVLRIKGSDIIELYPDIDRRLIAKILNKLLCIAYLEPRYNNKAELIELIKERLN